MKQQTEAKIACMPQNNKKKLLVFPHSFAVYHEDFSKPSIGLLLLDGYIVITRNQEI